ncbi:MAG: hypothetical protein AAB885_00865, partial [Patescibacteria group bacterium]
LAQYKTYRDSLQAYLGRAREVYEGHFPPSELYGDHQLPTVQNPLPPALFAPFLVLFGGNTDSAYLGAQFFFVGAIFALFYWLGWLFTASRAKALFLGLTGTLTPIVLKLPFYKWQGLAEFQAFFLNNFFPFVRTQFDQLYLARVDEPLLTYPIYLAAIALFFLFWRSPSRVNAVWAGIFSGLIFYTYFHHWVYWTIAWGTLFVYSLIFRKYDPNRLRYFIWFLIAFAIAILPYVVGYLQFSALPTSSDFTYRAGVAFGRVVGIDVGNLADYAFYIGLAVVVWATFWRRDKNMAIFLLALISAMFLVWNVQLVAGFSPVPHFFRRPIAPAIFIVSFAVIFEIIKRIEARWRSAEKIIVGIFLVLSAMLITKKIVNIVYINCCLQSHLVDYYRFPGEVAESWDWIKENIPGEPKIISPSTMTSFYLTSHTAARPYLPTAFTTLMSMQEMEDRYLTSHKLFGVSGETLRKRLAGQLDAGCESYECFPDKGSNLNDSFGNLYGNYFPSRYGSFHQFLSGADREIITKKRGEKIEELIRRYQDLKVNWQAVPADYVFVGPMEEQLAIRSLENDSGLSLIYKNSLVKIYAIRR